MERYIGLFQGEILIKGVQRMGLLSDHNSEPIRVGMVFQSGALFDSLTVGENVGFLLYEHSHLRTPDIQKLVKSCLLQVGLKVRTANMFPLRLVCRMSKIFILLNYQEA